ncbi:transposase [Paenibacillus sp. Dod16]|uniref:transposase n=1 Tax=unclassified Paenibacillus TaxID=185978 RepID=UPI0035BEBE64
MTNGNRSKARCPPGTKTTRRVSPRKTNVLNKRNALGLTNRGPWRNLPEYYSSWPTFYSRFRRWQITGIWD